MLHRRRVHLHGAVVVGDVTRLSAFIRSHIGIDGYYSFYMLDLGGTQRPLRDPTPATTSDGCTNGS